MTEELVNTIEGQTTILGRGFHGIVERDTESGLVYKRILRSDTETALELARREYRYLQRFSGALAEHVYLACPHPVEFKEDDAAFWMTYCSGVRVDKLLSGPDDVDEHIDHIAEQIASGIQTYVSEFGEPLYSLATHNMIYDPDTWVLSLYDFTMARSIAGIDVHSYPHEVTLGCFLSATTRFTVRVRSCTKRRYWDRQRRLSIGILQHMFSAESLDLSMIERVNSIIYPALGMKDRRLSRRLWYATVGAFLFNTRTVSILQGGSVSSKPVEDPATMLE